MVDIQSATAEIKRGKKEEKETWPKYNVHICYAGRPLLIFVHEFSSIKCLLPIAVLLANLVSKEIIMIILISLLAIEVKPAHLYNALYMTLVS